MEAAIEGPFSKKYKGSYLINYRYSTLSLIEQIGCGLEWCINYSDLSYHINLPLNKGGHFSLFGLNGWSDQNIDETLEDIDVEKGALDHRFEGEFLSNMSVNGAKYTYSTKNNGFLSAIIAYGTTKSGFADDQRTVYPSYTYLSKYDIENLTDKVSGAVHYTTESELEDHMAKWRIF
jgi:hypothetical protein